MIRLAMAVEGADRLSARGPDAVIVDASRHYENQNFVAVQLWRINDFDLHRRVRRAVTFAADRPCVHLFRHMTQRRDFANFVKVLRRVVQSHDLSPVSCVLQWVRKIRSFRGAIR